MGLLNNYRRKIVIEQLTNTKNGIGSTTKTWSTYKTVYASVTEKQGSKKFDDDQETSFFYTRFKFLYFSGLKWNMRIKFNSKYYDIKSINITENNSFFEEYVVDAIRINSKYDN